MLRPVLYLIILFTALSSIASAETVTADLRLADGHGCYISSEGAGLWISLFRPGSTDSLYMEAEQASLLTLEAGKEVGRDRRCGSGGYAAFVTNAEFQFEVRKAGQYQGWARTYLPRYGSWNHQESMDGGKRQRISESTLKIFGKWFWSKLGKYRLGAGRHTFVLHNWLGGARLDAVVFSSDPRFKPTGLRGTPVIGGRGRIGCVTTGAIVPSGVAKWTKLVFDAELNGGSVVAEASSDEGRHWISCGHDGGLGMLTPRGDGCDSLMARFTLHASAEGVSPVVRSASVSFELAARAEMVMGNQHYQIAVARQTGRLCGVLNRAVGMAYMPMHLQEPIMGLAVREPGATVQRVVSPESIRFDGIAAEGRSAALRYSAVDGQIRILVQMAADDTPLSRWQCTVENRSALEVIRVDFPLIGNAAIGDYVDDECVIPRTGGWRIKTPAAEKAWKTTYMGGGSMGWLDLCDENAGLYVAMLDRELTTTEMECAPADGQQGTDLAMRAHVLVKPAEIHTRDYVIGVHAGDWHWAADRYREWACSWMKHPDPPEWLKWCDGWVHGSGKVKFGAMGRLAKRAAGEGLEYIQYWGHMSDGINQCCGNFYWPAPALGGAEGFMQGVADVHAQGGRVTAYMNCQTWTRDSAVNESLRLTPKSKLPKEALDLIHAIDWFEKWRLFPLDGKPMGYYASTLGWYIMCPASKGFHEHLRFWIVDMYCKRFGVDGIYIDQTGATAAKPCYNLDHGHGNIGHWGKGNVELLRTCIEQARAVNPDFIIAIEGAGDALGQYADLHLISGLCTHPEVYHYTFPDHILISGLSNSSHLSFRQRITRAFLNGDRFDVRVGNPLVQSAMRLRQRIKRWLYPGRFMDTVGLRTSDERVLARWNLCEQRGARAIVVTFDNEHEVADATCELDLPSGWRRPRSLHEFDREGGVSAGKSVVADRSIALRVSSSTLSAGILMYETRPAHSVDAWCAPPLRGSKSDAVVLRAANLGGEAQKVKLTVEAEAPLRLAQRLTEIDMPASGVAQLELGLTVDGELKNPARVGLDISWPGGSRRCTTFVWPVFVNGGLEVDEDEDGCPDYWRVGGTTGDFPYGIENGAFWIQGQKQQYQYLIQEVPLKPLTEYHFAGRIRRSGSAKGVSIAVVEFVGERGYRMHYLGRDEKLLGDEWHGFETRLTTGKDFWKCAVYLYNTHTDVRAWYDDLVLRPVE